MTDESSPNPLNAPRLRAPSFVCPHCGAFTQQEWSEIAEVEEDGWSALYDLPPSMRNAGAFWESRPQWWASTCFVCSKKAIWRGDSIVFPSASALPRPHRDLAGAALTLYDEAAAVAPHSRRASAALARAALEALLKQLDASPRIALDDRIAKVQSQVSQPLGQLLTIVRHVGNKALHGADDTDELVALVLDGEDAEVLEVLFEAINGLVDELITRPQNVSSMYAKVPASIREAAEAKAAKKSPTE